MNGQSYQEVRALFDAALEQPAEERALFVARHCQGNNGLRNEVEALLAAHAQPDHLLDKHRFNDDWEAQSGERGARLAGRRLGAYRVLHELGRGGMATVYLAERADELYQKKVAIKLLDRGWSWRETELRFQQERQILARLDHPNIARLLDAGTDADGFSYLVMEYVEGQPIHHYCRERFLPLPERLRLFLSVCEAVASAHRSLVIHRDLKPSNILVSAQGQPKLLDFGIAKLLEGGEWRTITGLQRMTPEYASPEQIRGDAATTASDIYSLGVLLFQLLTERLPYRLESLSPLQMSHAVLEEEPLRPSTLDSKLAGDLEAILLKALRKEPEHRYRSVDALREEIERYLEGRPVQARRGTFSYRAGKFLRRHTAGVAAAVLVAIALAVTTGTALRSARTALTEAERNERLLYVAHIKAAAEAWEAGDVNRALERLEMGRPKTGQTDRRGFEWFLLWKLLHPDSFSLTAKQGTLRPPLGFSPDSRLIASAGADNSVEMFDSAGGRWLRTLKGHSDKVSSLVFSPDGAVLATGSYDRTVVLWETASGRPMQILREHDSVVFAVSFSPDGQRLASASHPDKVKLWNWKEGKLLLRLQSGEGRCEFMDFSPDGKMLAGGTQTGHILLWDANSGMELGRLSGGSRSISSLDFSPDSRQLAAASASGAIQIWDVAKRLLLLSLNRHSGGAESLVYSADGRRLASIAQREVLIWNPATGQVLAEFMGSGTMRGSLAFSPSGRTLLTSGWDQTILLWDVEKASALQTLSGVREGIGYAAFSPDSKTFVTASRTAGARFWEVATGRFIEHLGVRSRFAEISPDGERLAVGITDGVVLLYPIPLGAETPQRLNTNFHRVISAAFSPDGRLLAIRGDHPTAEVWDLDSNRLLANLPHDKRVSSVVFFPSGQHFDFTVSSLAFSPDGRTIASGSENGKVHLWTPTGDEIGVLDAHEGAAGAVAFASVNRLVTGGNDGVIKLWDLPAGRVLVTYSGQLPSPWHLAVSPDGRRLASASRYGQLKVWELDTGMDLLALKLGGQAAQMIAFSPDGHCLAAVGYDGDVRLWHAAAGEPSDRRFAGPH
jgi:WD40 repeat protein/predicted Ser/Thr protein kinase